MSLHGINIPVFALKTESSGGIGEYLDLLPLIDWASEVGLKILQILPINDTGNDPSPYHLRSGVALNPLYIKWPKLKAEKLNQLKAIDYDAVRELKLQEVKRAQVPENELRGFVEAFPWVETYAKQSQGELSIIEQYLCYTQMQTVKRYAEAKGIKLFGDIPILIAPDSIDVQLYPQLFKTSLVAGAPPDMYNKEGQNWGLPLYNWFQHEQEHYSWWKERLAYANEFYDYFRLDHVVGFYRIWSCKPGQKALLGEYLPKAKTTWIPQGEKILKMILNATSMRPIAEDLGTVPPEVRRSLIHLGIPGTRVLRWDHDYPKISLTTVSTHDSTLLRVENPHLTGSETALLLRHSHHTPSFFHINLLQEYFSVIHDLRDDTRINTPGTISKDNWTWRMKPTLEEMRAHEPLKLLMRYCLG